MSLQPPCVFLACPYSSLQPPSIPWTGWLCFDLLKWFCTLSSPSPSHIASVIASAIAHAAAMGLANALAIVDAIAIVLALAMAIGVAIASAIAIVVATVIAFAIATGLHLAIAIASCDCEWGCHCDLRFASGIVIAFASAMVGLPPVAIRFGQIGFFKKNRALRADFLVFKKSGPFGQIVCFAVVVCCHCPSPLPSVGFWSKRKEAAAPTLGRGSLNNQVKN